MVGDTVTKNKSKVIVSEDGEELAKFNETSSHEVWICVDWLLW